MSEINDTKELPEVSFPINLKFIQRYQRAETSIISKYKNGTYHKGSFRGVRNIDINLIMCADNVVIPEKIQCYVLN